MFETANSKPLTLAQSKQIEVTEMETPMHHWFDVTFCTLFASIIASVAWLLSLFPSGVGGELIHFAFVLVGGLVTATVTHYWRKWLEARDKAGQLKLEESKRSSESES